MALNKLVFVLPVLLALSAGAVLDCAKVHSVGTYEYQWNCVQGSNHGQMWIPDAGMPGSYPKWHVVVDYVSPAAGHYVTVSCWHDVSSPLKGGRSGGSVWESTLNINSNFVRVATTLIEEGFWTPSGGVWASAGCPRVVYINYQYADSVHQAYIQLNWAYGKRSWSSSSVVSDYLIKRAG
ncbi:MAG: hypothetical protein WC607_03945 [Candidatus Micrarchaeia archaeon]